MNALFWKIWRFLESHSIWVFTATAAMTVFILFDPWCRQAWDIFFTHNGRILEIYWQTLTILLVIFIPILGQSFKKLEEDFAGIGAKIFFEQVVCARKFWVLVPFSFLFFFAFPSEDFPLNQAVLTGIHYVLFVTWCFLFWKFFSLTKKSIEILVTRGKVIMKIFYDYLEGYQGNHKRQTKIGEDDSEEESWRLLWNIIDAQKEKWRKKFLGLFWRRLENLVVAKQYALVNELLNDFVKSYLKPEKKRDQDERIHWMNARKRWLWFHEKQGSDGRENPFTVVSHLLELHWQCWEVSVSWKKPGDGTTSDIETWGELYGLTHTLSNTLENLFRDELDGTDDYYYSFFRCLTGFFGTVAPDKSTLSLEKYREYLKSLPIYRPVFEAAYNSHLSSYEPHAEGSGFPNRWRVLEVSLEQTFSLDGTDNDVQRLVWLNQFVVWSRDHIDHGKTEWDNVLDMALKMLFPEAYAPWMAFTFAYKALAFGKSRIAGLCSWHQNFGQSQATWTDISDIAQRKNWQVRRDQREKDEEQKQKDVAAKIIQKLGFFGTPKDTQTLIGELQNLGESFEKESESERNRQEILDMLQAVGKLGSFVK